jgi:hypothetical protein
VNIGNDALKPIGQSQPEGSVPAPAPAPASDDSPAGVTVKAYALRVTTLPNDTAAQPPVDSALVGVPEALQTMNSSLRVASQNRESALLEERMRFFAEELEEAHRAGIGESVYLRHLGGIPRIAVMYNDENTEVRIDTALLGALGNTVRSANRIYLHAHGDAYSASDGATQLAIRRAVELRDVLVSLNVEPERIRLFYRGAGDFVANNSTRKGKALNRRVEIELRKW